MRSWDWFARRPDRGAWVSALVGIAILIINTRAGAASGLRMPAQWTWAATLLLLLLVIAVIGASVNGRPDGVLIDNRNRVSLSKLQALLWTLLVLSAVIVAVAAKAYATGGDAALELRIPTELLVAMGISSASLAATPLILRMKSSASVEPRTLAARNEFPLTIDQDPEGANMVFSRGEAAEASWADLFRGEEVSNAASPDLGKIQQFIVSVGLVTLYGGMLWARFADGRILQTGAGSGFPPLNDTFVWLLGISHASYLAYKATPHGSAASSPAAATVADEAVG